LEYQAEEMAARRARKEREHKRKLRRYLDAYRKRLAQNAQDTQKKQPRHCDISYLDKRTKEHKNK